MKYPGIYRGYVVANDDSEEDPPFLGRVKVNIPQIYGEQVEPEGLPWAEACVPFFGGGLAGSDGKQTSGVVAIPPVGATVWVMFEEGNLQHPVYMGTWCGMLSETLTYDGIADYPDVFVFKTPWSTNAVLRIISSKLLELMFDDMKVLMESNKTEADPEAQSKLTIRSAEGNILIEAPEGSLTLRADSIAIDSTHNLDINAGHSKIDPWLGPVVETEGDLAVLVTKNSRIFTNTKGLFEAAKDGGWFMRAENVSGFEEHGGRM